MKNFYILLVCLIVSQSYAQMNYFPVDSNWIKQESGTDDRLLKIFMKNTSEGMIAGERTLLKTIDGGESWLLNDTLIQPYQRIMDIYTLDNSTFWMILQEDVTRAQGSKAEHVYHIMKSTDSTDTWSILHTSEDTYLSSLHFADSLNGWVVGSEMSIMHTSDGGHTWTEQLSDTSVMLLRDVFFVNETTGFAIGSNATILKTSNGGQDWTIKGEDLPWSSLQTIHFVNETTGWIGGSNGMIYYTNNAGETWQYTQLGISDYIYSFYMKNEQLGWATSSSGRLFATTQGATSWKISDTLSRYNLFAIDFPDEDNGWIVGDEGLILHTRNADGGLFVVERKAPGNLFTIFPNPVSESFYLSNNEPSARTVDIRILDVSGNEVGRRKVSFLPNESVEVWNLDSFPSGMYQIQINYENQTELHKLLKY